MSINNPGRSSVLNAKLALSHPLSSSTRTTTTMPPLRIAILGAGPAGLTLARLLQLQTKPEQATITIYERDTGIDSRNQGGTLDLHPETGQYALKKAGLLEEFLKVARKEVAEMRVYDGTDGRLNFLLPASLEGSGQDRPEIDRCVLSAILSSLFRIRFTNTSLLQSHSQTYARELSTTRYDPMGSSHLGYHLTVPRRSRTLQHQL